VRADVGTQNEENITDPVDRDSLHRTDERLLGATDLLQES
jgi:hypothetical protein